MGSKSSRFSCSQSSLAVQECSHLNKKPKTVYYKGKEFTADKLLKRTEQVMEMIVCKTANVGHWFIKLVLNPNIEKPLELHYVDNGSIQVYYPKDEQLQVKKETRYAPESNVKLAHILEECLDFVESKPYSFLSYNCQDFVTIIMSKFTNRKTTSFLSIPVLSHTSSFRAKKKKIMILENQFLLSCQGEGVESGLASLEEINRRVKEETDEIQLQGEESGPDMERFVYSVLKPMEGDYSNSNYEGFLKSQSQETREKIKDYMLYSWRLASFIIFLEEKKWENREDFWRPSQAFEEYQYDFRSS